MEVSQQYIKQIYKAYFELIDSFFGSIKPYLWDEKDSHIDLGNAISGYPLISDLIIDAIGDLDFEIEKFWHENANTIVEYIKSKDTLKCLYSGDISPVVLEDFIKKSSLYVDTVIIADPIYNLSVFQKQAPFNSKFYLNKIVRHVFNIWKIKDLILADSKEDILIILPVNLKLVSQKDRDDLLEEASNKFTNYVSSITNRGFSDADDCLSFLEGFSDSYKIFSIIENPQFLPTSLQNEMGFWEFLDRFGKSRNYSQFMDMTSGRAFWLYVHSQFVRVQEHKFFCDKLIAEPIYDYELPWFFFNLETGYRGIDSAIINSLQKEKFEWISRVPISAIKILRSENRLEYMRSLLRKSITDLKTKNDTDLLNVWNQIEKNFQEAFKEQRGDIARLEKEVASILKKEIPITTGGFLAGFVPYLGNAVSIATAGRDIKNLLDRCENAKMELSYKRTDFISLLMVSNDDR